MLTLNIILLAVSVVVFFVLVYNSIVITREGDFKAIERFGKFKGVREPGISFKIPFVDRVRVMLKITSITPKEEYVSVSATTKDGAKTLTKIYVSYKLIDGFEPMRSVMNMSNLVKAVIFSKTLEVMNEISADSYYNEKNRIEDGVRESIDLRLEKYNYHVESCDITYQEVVDSGNAKSVSLSRKGDGKPGLLKG